MTLFADTFYWIALTDSTDEAHERALAITAENGLTDVLTNDWHFEQEGFRALLRGANSIPLMLHRGSRMNLRN